MDFKVTRDDSYLEHHGVLGMKADQDRYAKQFNKDMSVNYNNMMYEDLSQNKHYQRATNLYKQYSLHKVNTLAGRNQKYHDEVDRYLKSKGL
jgi:tRNA G46 methylase TrmB